jgi:signal transduction histidine kinase
VADTGEDGFFLATTQRFDLILLDLMLPGRGGLEILAALREQRDAASYREAIGSMLEEADRLSRLADDLLTLARGDSGTARRSPRRIDLTGLTSGSLEELRVLAEEKGQTITLNGTAPIEVVADPDTLRRALLNVLHNAIRHTPVGGEIKISVARDDLGDPFIEVCDSGPGIPADVRGKVFERFYRVEEARSRASGGSGLGLAIARWAVEVSRGRIEFLEPEEQGARCRITLPA